MKSQYWVNGNFAGWIRGTPKIEIGTSEEWEDWKNKAQSQHPIRYWIAEEGLDKLQKIVYYIPEKLNDLRYYINNRWVSHSHQLTAHSRDIKPGQWQDVGNRFLPCLFNELVDFVEVEQAWYHCMWSDEARIKYSVPWWRSGWLRLRTWRCPEAGLDYLNWASSLTNKEFIEDGETEEPTYQAKAAKEIIELYTWWTTTYRNRPDPYEASGWRDYCDKQRTENGDGWLGRSLKTSEDEELSRKILSALHATEEAYEQEEEEMMIRLIKVRQGLWT